MRKRTTTQKLNEAIKNNILILERAEICNKTSGKTETIDADKFYEDFSFLCESGYFANALGWHYELNHETGDYEIECGRMNGDVDFIVIAYFNVNDSTNPEEIDKVLQMEESED